MPGQDYPEIELSKELRGEMENFLAEEFSRCRRMRQNKVKEWKELREIYDQTELKEKKNFPFEGAAHLMLGIIPMFTESIYARLINTLWTPTDPFTPKPFRKDFQNHVRPLRTFCTWASKEELKLEEFSYSALFDYVLLGECVSKTIYSREERGYKEWDEGAGEYIDRIKTVKDHPEVIDVAVEDYWYPMEARTHDEKYWEAHRFFLTWSEVKQREAWGWFKSEYVKELESHPADPFEINDAMPTRDAAEKANQGQLDKYEIFDVWFEYVIDDSGIAQKLCGYFNRDLGKLLSVRANWYPFQLSPFDHAVYSKRSRQVGGNGVGQMAKATTLEVSTMHNQRLDAATLANSTMFKVKRDAVLGTTVKVKPGGSIPVSEMDDVDVMQIGRDFNTTIDEENHTLGLLQQRIGIFEYQQNEQLQNAPATTTLSNMQEKLRRFDLVVRFVRTFFSSIVTKSLLLYQRYYPDGKAFMLLGEDGFYVEELFRFNDIDFLNGIGIQVTATTSASSRELERQAKLSLFTLLRQFYQDANQYLIGASNPQVPPVVKQTMLAVVVGLSTFVLELLEDYEIRHADELALGFAQLREAATRQAAEGVAPTGAGAGGMGDIPRFGADGNGQGGLPAQAGAGYSG